MESILWSSEGFNPRATTVNSDMLSSDEVFFGGRQLMPALSLCKPAYHRVPQRSKMDPQTHPCFSLNFGYNHGSDCFKIMDMETGRVLHSRDVTLFQPRESLISPAPTVGSGVPYLSSGAEMPDYAYIQPTPVGTATPTTAPVPAPATVAPVPASAPPLITVAPNPLQRAAIKPPSTNS